MPKDPLLTLYATIKKINLVCLAIAGLILLFINSTIFIDVFLRYFFERPSIWITEVSTYLFLYIIFLATPYALQKGQHIRVTFLRFHLSPAVTRILDLVCSLLAMTFCAVLLWQVTKMTWSAYEEQWVSPTLLSAPLAYVYGVMAVGSALLLVTFLLKALLEFRGGGQEENGGDVP